MDQGLDTVSSKMLLESIPMRGQDGEDVIDVVRIIPSDGLNSLKMRVVILCDFLATGIIGIKITKLD